MMDIRPNHTIYINNLNEKLKKDGKLAFIDMPFMFMLKETKMMCL